MAVRALSCPGCRSDATRDDGEWFDGARLLRCLRCGTQWADPQPSDERLGEIYDAEYYEPWTYEDPAGLDAMKRRSFAPILRACHATPGSSLLDVGCATGSFVGLAGEQGFRAFGIDINAHAIAAARERFPDAKLRVGQLADEPFGEQTFDSIVMVDFLEHVREPESELRRARSLLNRGGRLVVSTPCVDSLARRAFGRRWPQYREEHLTFFSREGLRSLLARVALEPIGHHSTRKAITLAYAYGQSQAYPIPVISPMTGLTYKALPFLRHKAIRVPFGEITVVARTAG